MEPTNDTRSSKASSAEDQPVVGAVPGTSIAPSTQPALQTEEQASPAPTAPSNTGALPILAPLKPKSKKWFWLVVVAIAVVALGGGASAAYYFGYYMNSDIVWKQSLRNTGKGYDKLVDYLSTQSKAHYKGLSETGSFKLLAASTNYDGNFNFKSDGMHTSGSIDVGLGVARPNLQIRSIKQNNANSSDVYLQLNGIKGLGSVLDPTLGQQLDGLDGQWVAIDHTLIDDLTGKLMQASSDGTKKSMTLHWNDALTAAEAVGNVNKQYLFTGDTDKRVMIVTKVYGAQDLDGHKTIHYQVKFDKQHVKNYITALRNALKQGKFGDWLQTATGKSIDNAIGYSDLQKQADTITDKDTLDVWVDSHTRLIYKVRTSNTSNPAENYTELGLNYKGGDSYPIFLNVADKTSGTPQTLGLTATLNSKNNTLTLHFAWQTSSSSPVDLSGDFTFKPSNDIVSVPVPGNAKPLSQVMSELGLSQFMQLLSAASATGDGLGNLGVSL